MKKYDFPKSSLEELFNDIYFKSLAKTKENEEYKNNIEKIDLYQRILKNNYSVNSDIIESLISAVEEKIELEYEIAIKNAIEYIEKNKL